MKDVFFIAEAGVNHNGRLDLALKLVEVAAEVGADAVKFQTFRAEETVVEGTGTVAYQKRTTDETNQFNLLKALELSADDHRQLRKRCDEVGIEFMSTAFDIESAHLLKSLGVQRLKVPSGELTNLPFLQELASLNLPMIISTGMGTIEEIHDALRCIAAVKKRSVSELGNVLSILHCTSAYPAPDDELNLLAIRTLAKTFDLPVGYSDHSTGSIAAFMAVALGSTVYEKHFTLDQTMEGPDHAASMEPDELKALVTDIRKATSMCGNGEKVPQPSEIEVRRLVRRSIVARRDLPVGHLLKKHDLRILRPEGGLPPRSINHIDGLRLARALKAGQPVLADDLIGYAAKGDQH